MRVLVVEDDRDLGNQVRRALEDAGFVVDLAPDGEEGKFLGETEPYDVIVLDLGLPKAHGLSLLKDWREAGNMTPVLILSARDRWTEKVEGLDHGANDYLTKPFHIEELLARLRALLRVRPVHGTSVLECGDLHVDTRAARVTVAGEAIRLTSHEYKVLDYLMHHRGRVVPRMELVEKIYGQDFDRDSNTIEVFIGRLRRKIGQNRIQTEKGLGYRLVDPAEVA